MAITKVDLQDVDFNNNIPFLSVSSEIFSAHGYQISVSLYQLTFSVCCDGNNGVGGEVWWSV